MSSGATNAVKLDSAAIELVLGLLGIMGRDARRLRTAALLREMRAAGFDPDRGDICIANVGLRDEFNEHPALRFSPCVNGAVFLHLDQLMNLLESQQNHARPTITSI